MYNKIINPQVLLERTENLFTSDLILKNEDLEKTIISSSFLVIGGAGSIGQAVTKEIFKRNPKKLHIVDISENNLVELTRDLRSSIGYISGEYATFCLDVNSVEYDAFINQDGQYDYILNLSALKHVRSEKDPFTLMRMIEVNILNTNKTLQQAINNNTKKYFSVSSDKAANPANMMGASKKIMEMFIMNKSKDINVSMARFANVAFSDGSLLYGFNQRIQKQQPIVAPNDVKRYFITPKEAGELCLLSCIFGENQDIFFPKLNRNLHLTTFSDIAINYLENIGYEPYICKTEDEAREQIKSLPEKGKWPCLFTQSDTTGEKEVEEFFTEKEILDMQTFSDIGIIKNKLVYNNSLLANFESNINTFQKKLSWTKDDLVNEFFKLIPDFKHQETRKYLDSKM